MVQVTGSGLVSMAMGPAFQVAHGSARRNLATASMIKKVTARTPMLVAASVLVVISLVQKDRPATPLVTVALRTWGLWGEGRDSQRDHPSGLLVCAQHRGSGSCANRSVWKPKPPAAAINSPANVAGKAVAGKRPAADRLLTAANQITTVAGKNARVVSENAEKLAAKESNPRASRRPPRTPGVWCCPGYEDKDVGRQVD